MILSFVFLSLQLFFLTDYIRRLNRFSDTQSQAEQTDLVPSLIRYSYWVTGLITVTNCLRVVTFFNLNTGFLKSESELRLPLEIILQLFSFQNQMLYINKKLQTKCSLISYFLYSIVVFLISVSRGKAEVVRATIFIFTLFLFLIAKRTLEKQEEIVRQSVKSLEKSGQSTPRLELLATPFSENVHLNAQVQENQAKNRFSLNLENPGAEPVFHQIEKNEQQLGSSKDNGLLNTDFIQSFVSSNKASPVGIAVINSNCKPLVFNDMFIKQLKSSVKEQIQNTLRNLKVIKVDSDSQAKFKISKDKSSDNYTLISRRSIKHKSLINKMPSGQISQDSFHQQVNQSGRYFYELLSEYEQLLMCDELESITILESESSMIDAHRYIIQITSTSEEERVKLHKQKREDGICQYFMIYIVDIDEKLKHCQKQIRLMIMNQLFRSFSHEFSTSLNGILGLAQTAEDTYRNNESLINDFIKPTLNSCYIMNSIVQDIRDFSMLLCKQFIEKIEQTNIGIIIHQCQDLFKNQLEMRRIKFDFKKELYSSAINVRTDCSRLKQIIINLLSNAQKHTQQGSIIVRLEEVILNNQRYVKIFIQDTGCGMDEEDQYKLSQMLQNEAIVQPKKQITNFGLGLFISNQLALKLSKLSRSSGGGIKFETKVNVGTLFWFMIKDQSDKLNVPQGSLIVRKGLKSNEMSLVIQQSQQTHQQRYQSQIQLGKETNTPKIHNFLSESQGSIGESRISIQSNIKQATPKSYKSSPQQFMFNIDEQSSECNQFLYIIIQDKSEDFEEFNRSIASKRRKEDSDRLNQNSESRLKHPTEKQITFNGSQRKIKCVCNRIIVIDDEQINIFALTMMIKMLGLGADNGNNGLDVKIKQVFTQTQGFQKVVNRYNSPCKDCESFYEVIFMDIDMPELNGIEATQKILKFCQSQQLRRPIIVAQTGFVDAETQKMCFKAGMTHFLSKPIIKAELKKILGLCKMI